MNRAAQTQTEPAPMAPRAATAPRRALLTRRDLFVSAVFALGGPDHALLAGRSSAATRRWPPRSPSGRCSRSDSTSCWASPAYLSFGHAAFFGTGRLHHRSVAQTPVVRHPAGDGRSHWGDMALLALLLGLLTLRRAGIYFSILSLAFAEMLHALVLSSTLQKWTGGDNGLTGLASPAAVRQQPRRIARLLFLRRLPDPRLHARLDAFSARRSG